MLYNQIILSGFLIGLINLDVYAIGQIMISRPVVIGPIVGLGLGDVMSGLIIGAFIELLYLYVIPVGVVVPPNCSIITGISTVLYILICSEIKDSSCLVVILAYTIPLGMIFKRLEIFQRNINVKIVHYIDSAVNQGRLNVVKWVSIPFFLGVFLKASLFSIIAIILGLFVVKIFIGILPSQVWNGITVVYKLLPMLGLAVAFNTFYVKMRE